MKQLQQHSNIEFSLIVCTIDRTNELEHLLQSLTHQTIKNFEVIIIDQNPSGTLEGIIKSYLEILEINHIYSKKGLSLARNKGIEHAQGNYICFPDDDCWYKPDTLKLALNLFNSNSKASLITGKTVDQNDNDSVSQFMIKQAEVNRHNYIKGGNSASLFVKKEVFDTIGRFDERMGLGAETPFQSGEESDFILRALGKNLSILFYPQLTIHHNQISNAITNKAIIRAKCYGAGYGALLKKHKFSKMYVLYKLFRPLTRAFLYLITFHFNDSKYKYASATGMLYGYLLWSKYKPINK